MLETGETSGQPRSKVLAPRQAKLRADTNSRLDKGVGGVFGDSNIRTDYAAPIATETISFMNGLRVVNARKCHLPAPVQVIDAVSFECGYSLASESLLLPGQRHNWAKQERLDHGRTNVLRSRLTLGMSLGQHHGRPALFSPIPPLWCL